VDEGKTIIVGLGEIGKAVKEAICPDALEYDINMTQPPLPPGPYYILHICFPYSEGFVEFAREYINTFQPKHIAIWSTVPIGTTKQIDSRAVHTPIEGKHPELAKSISLMSRWVGYNDKVEGRFFRRYFSHARIFNIEMVDNTDHTEALKLLSTTEYGVNLVYADYKKRVADDIGMDYELTKRWNADYNELYEDLGLPQFQKFILDPPNGEIGGHCIVPNAALLNNQFPDTLVERISNMGKPQEKKS
jgi:hypothetical protein